MKHAPNPLRQHHTTSKDDTVTTPTPNDIDHVIPPRGTHPASSHDLVDMIRSKAQRAPTLPDDYFNDIDSDVLDAMENVSRSYYLPDTTLAATRHHASKHRRLQPTTEFTYPRDTIPQPAYYDTTLPIGHEQTMSQPSVIAYMNSLLDIDRGDHAYEIGTGSGYHAAITAEQVGNNGRLITTERQPELFRHSKRKLDAADHDADINVNAGDGIDDLLHRDDTFDHVYATAGIPGDTDIPIDRLRRRLRPGGTLLLPQQDGPLLHYTDRQDNPAKRSHAIFVPLKTRWDHTD